MFYFILLPLGSLTELLRIMLLTLHATCPTYFTLLCLITLTILYENTSRNILMHFSLASCYLLFPSTSTLNLYSLIIVTELI
jgi:hypothetical protein